MKSTSRMVSNKIIYALQNRGRLKYKMMDICKYLMHFLCIRSMYKWGKKFKLRKHLLYTRGFDKI